MNGSFRNAGLTLGSVALVVLAAACSRATRPAKTTSPTFESNVPEQTTPPPMGTMPPGALPAETPPTAPSEEAHPPSAPAPESALPAPMPAEPTAPPPEAGGTEPTHPSEASTAQSAAVMASELCESLTRGAGVRIEDVPGGAAVVMTPKTREDMDAVRDDARRFQQAFSSLATVGPAAQPPSGAGSSTCHLADMPHMGATASVTEGPKAVRLLITSSDPAQVKPIRRELRDFAKTHMAPARGGAPHAAPPKKH